jgi:hypothetical protein
VDAKREERGLLTVDLGTASSKLFDEKRRYRAHWLHVLFVRVQIVGRTRMMIPNEDAHASRVPRRAIEHLFNVGQAAASSDVGHHQQVNLRQIEILTTLRPKPIAMQREILMDVRCEATAQANHRTWEQLLQSHARCQCVKVGGLVRGDQLHVAGSNVSWSTRNRST